MAEGCMYCEAGDERRLELMTPIVDLKVSSLPFLSGTVLSGQMCFGLS